MGLGYFRNVAFELRMRGVTEKQVAFELARIAAAGLDDPKPEFGTPKEVAAVFEERKAHGLSQKIVSAAGVITFGFFGVQAAGLLLGHTVWRIGIFSLVSCSIVPIAVTFAVAFALEFRLPKGFAATRSGSKGSQGSQGSQGSPAASPAAAAVDPPVGTARSGVAAVDPQVGTASSGVAAVDPVAAPVPDETA